MLSIAKRYNKSPSEILNIQSDYVAFCFDEACSVLLSWLEAGKTPKFIEEPMQKQVVKYSSFSEMYHSWGVD